MPLTAKMGKAYRTPVLIAATLQVTIITVTSFNFDFGALFRVALLAIVPFWGAVIWIAHKRPNKPSKFDLTFIRVGYLPIFAILLLLNFYFNL